MSEITRAITTALSLAYEVKDEIAQGRFESQNDAINAVLDQLVVAKKAAEGLTDNVDDRMLELSGLLADPRYWAEKDPVFVARVAQLQLAAGRDS